MGRGFLLLTLGAGLLLAQVQAAPPPDPAITSRNGSHAYQLRPGKGRCDAPSLDAASELVTSTCYSTGIPLAPGHIENAFYTMPNPFPADETVGVVHHSSQVVEAGTGRLVPLSEVYLHHVFSDGLLVAAEGSEHAGSKLQPDRAQPFYQIVPKGRFAENHTRIVNIHVISTLGVAERQRCIECWCMDGQTTQSGGLGGGACCSHKQCPSSMPASELRTYELQFTVVYRVLESSTPVKPVHSMMMDAVGGLIEFDVQPPENASHGNGSFVALSATGPLDARCSQTKPVQLLNCVGHLHIGGTQLRMINSETGEVLCDSTATYGTGAAEEQGNEHGYLVAMSMDYRKEPISIPAGTNVTIQALHKPERHYGVMALWFIDFVDFDTSCPGVPAPADEGGYTVFGPDYAHQKGTGFGHYAGLIPHIENGTLVTGHYNGAQPAGKTRAMAVPVLLAGAVVGVALLLLSAAALVVRRRQMAGYAQLQAQDAPTTAFVQPI